MNREDAFAVGTRIGQAAGAVVLLLMAVLVLGALAAAVIFVAFLAHVGWAAL